MGTFNRHWPGHELRALQRAFDPYYTTREGDAGLGLSAVRQLISQASGSVIAENQPGSTARFVIRLPSVGGRA